MKAEPDDFFKVRCNQYKICLPKQIILKYLLQDKFEINVEYFRPFL